MPGEAGCAIPHPVEGWVARFGPELRAHLGRMLASDEDAEDALQQVWIAAYRQPPDDGPGSNIRAWLYRVATNAALDSLSRDRRHKRKLGEWDTAVGMGEASPPPDAALATLDERSRARVRELCARLPRKQREAVWRRWAEGEDYASIARELDTSVQSARANVYHGLTRLRRELFDLWKEELG